MPSLSRDSLKEGLLSERRERERDTIFIYLKSKTDRKGGNHSYRNVNNNNHNNSLLFSRRLFDAAFSSEREWVERVEPHPLRAPFFLPSPAPPSLPSLHPHAPPPSYSISPFPISSQGVSIGDRGTDCMLFADLGSHVWIEPVSATFLERLFPSELSCAAEKRVCAVYAPIDCTTDLI